jgi:hypothetical protein
MSATERRHEARAVHQRAGGQRAAAAPSIIAWREFLDRFRHATPVVRSSRVVPQIAQIAVPPHHALGHAGGAAGVDEEHVVGRALDAERRAVALLRERRNLRERRDVAVRSLR